MYTFRLNRGLGGRLFVCFYFLSILNVAEKALYLKLGDLGLNSSLPTITSYVTLGRFLFSCL